MKINESKIDLNSDPNILLNKIIKWSKRSEETGIRTVKFGFTNLDYVSEAFFM
jgi:hypothetical protein